MKADRASAYRGLRAMAIVAIAAAAASCARPPIKVGVSLVLTGITAYRGVSARNGIELAAREINGSGGVRGRQIALLVRDDEDDPDRAAAADAELIDAGAVAILGHMASKAASKAVAVADSRRVPILSPSVASSDYSGKDDYFLRLTGTSDESGRELGAEAAARGARRVAVALEESNGIYTRSVLSLFASALEAAGGRIARVEPFTTSADREYGALADELLAVSPDAVFVDGSAFDAASICQALAKRGRRLLVLAPMWAFTNDIFIFGGKAVEGLVLSSFYDPGSRAPAYLRFKEAYAALYGREPDLGSVHGYNAMRYLAAALAGARRLDGPSVKQALLGVGPYEALQGRVVMDRFGDIQERTLILEIEGGRFVAREGG